ncbi:unnamed protein product [Cylicostephanus goldi]|uniref:Mediator of RNA polymerase II transcription subunit 10 n=1 Tax=Cylicostephanus goldi TaxID=71465 RepID=A0A3P6RTB7_CYLGO|nr:unnamed protein product [Cylicostephanus goldi]
MRNQFADVKVPLELLDVLDQGKNPQLYTKEVLERTLQKNKEVNGKVETKMSIGANAVFRPHNGVTAALIKFVPNFVALRLSWTQNSLKSEGLEQFVEEYLPVIRENNPRIKYFLHRTYTECDPFVVGEYTWMRSRRKRVSWRSKHQVLSMVEEMAVGGDFRPGDSHSVVIQSKWKADEDDLRVPLAAKHPNFVYRKY